MSRQRYTPEHLRHVAIRAASRSYSKRQAKALVIRAAGKGVAP